MIFFDTSFLCALLNAEDENHLRVREVKPSSEMRHRNAVQVGEHLFAGRLARVHRPSEDDEHRAFDYFRKYKDQEYSMVDCMSFVVMDQLGITEAWAVDSDFTHRFIARPGPKPK